MPAELALLGLLISATPHPTTTLARDVPTPALIEMLGTSDAELIKNDVPLEPDASIARPTPTTTQQKTIR